MREVKLLLVALALIVTANLYAQDTPNQTPGDSSSRAAACEVQGTVVSATTGEPLKTALVQLIDRQHAEPPRTFTDSSGHFVITGVPPGSYHFRASKVGYVEQAYHPVADGSAELLVLLPGQKLDKILFRLERAAVIVGRITDDGGEPVEGAVVMAMVAKTEEWGFPRSGNSIVPLQLALTDDLGNYRLYNLPPGGYYLAANDSIRGREVWARGLDWSMGLTRDTNHPPIYFPGVYDFAEARKVHLHAAQETRIDLSLRPVKTVSVSGQVLNHTGKPGAGASVNLEPTVEAPQFASRSWSAAVSEEGHFEIKGVFPGAYRISANIGQGGPLEDQYWTEQQIEVSGENLSGLQLKLRGGLEISGKLTAVGGSKPDFNGLGVILSSESNNTILGEFTAAVKKDGTFTLTHVRPTTNHLSLRGLADGWYLRSATFAGQNVLDDGLRLAEGNVGHSLEISVGSGVGQIDGLVRKGDAPVPGAKIKLFPDPTNPYRGDLFRTAWADQNGHFLIDNVAPGAYRVLAVDVEEEGEAEEPDDLPSATSIVLAEKESKTVQLNIDESHR